METIQSKLAIFEAQLKLYRSIPDRIPNYVLSHLHREVHNLFLDRRVLNKHLYLWFDQRLEQFFLKNNTWKWEQLPHLWNEFQSYMRPYFIAFRKITYKQLDVRFIADKRFQIHYHLSIHHLPCPHCHQISQKQLLLHGWYCKRCHHPECGRNNVPWILKREKEVLQQLSHLLLLLIQKSPFFPRDIWLHIAPFLHPFYTKNILIGTLE